MEPSIDNLMDNLIDPIDSMLDRLNVNTAFGEPAREGHHTIIPVAEISAGFGYGAGFGQGPAGNEEGEEEGTSGSGGGGGLGKAKPCGYIHITPDGVSYVPTMNPNVVPVAGIALLAWLIFWVAMVRKAVAKGQG